MRVMRITITLTDEVHERALHLAKDSSRSLSEVIDAALREVFIGTTDTTIRYDSLTGFPYVRAGRVVTSEEVRALEDDE